MFEVYKKEVEMVDATGNKNKFLLKPLSGRWLPKFYSAMKKLSPKKGEEEQSVSPEAIGELHELVMETFKKSYPDQEDDNLDEWVSQNLMKLIEPIIEVNLGKQDEQPNA